jgi:hypothetical protein
MSVNRYEFEDYGTNESDGRYVTYEDYAALEVRCAALAAENAGLKAVCEDRRRFIMNGVQLGYIQAPTVETDPALETIRVAVSPQELTPSTDAALAEVRAQHGESICASLLEKASEYDARAKEVDCHTTDNRYRFAAAMFRGFAAQLRKGVQS